MKEITITKREEGQRFDRFLIKYLPGASSGFLHKMLRKKNIKLNGKKAEGREKLTAGDLIQIFFSDETLEKFQNPQSGRDDSYEADSSMGNAQRRSASFFRNKYHPYGRSRGMRNSRSSGTMPYSPSFSAARSAAAPCC